MCLKNPMGIFFPKITIYQIKETQQRTRKEADVDSGRSLQRDQGNFPHQMQKRKN